MADGWITIETKLDTDKFDKQITNLMNKIEKDEEKAQMKIEVKAQQEKSLEIQRQKTEKLAQQYEKLLEYKKQYEKASRIAESSDFGSKKMSDALTKMLDLGPMIGNKKGDFGKIQELEQQLASAVSKEEELERKAEQTSREYQEILDRVSQYKKQIESINMKKQQNEVEGLKNSFSKVGSSIQNTIKGVGKLALGIFAVRSAYMLLSRASSELASYDKQYATNLEYIRYALTQMIAPVLVWIVNMTAKLLQLIGMIVNALFGVNIFSKGSAENFQKMKTGASGVGKAVKEIKKQLMGFDEINMLTDQTSTGTKAGAGGVGMPSFDLSQFEGNVPKWLEWIKNNRELILGFLLGVVTFLTLIRLGLEPIKALGIGVMVWGIVTAVMGLLQYLKDPTWQNFGKIITGIGITITGLGIAFLGLPAIVIGVATAILGIVVSNWEKIKNKLQDGIKWLTDKSDWVHKMFGDTIGNIYDSIVNILQGLLNYFDTYFTSIKGMFDGLIKFVKGVFTRDWSLALEGLKEIGINIFKMWFSKIEYLLNTVVNFMIGRINFVLSFFSGIVDKIIGLFGKIATKVPETISSKFKSVMNAIIGAIEKVLNTPIKAINKLIESTNSLPGVNISRMNTFSFPRLAVGGIVNMPNKGTLIGNAIAGESGKEGVIPLTDQQAMAELGKEIGKNVLVNLTNITQMNGRVISRELKQVKTSQDFAYNT